MQTLAEHTHTQDCAYSQQFRFVICIEYDFCILGVGSLCVAPKEGGRHRSEQEWETKEERAETEPSRRSGGKGQRALSNK